MRHDRKNRENPPRMSADGCNGLSTGQVGFLSLAREPRWYAQDAGLSRTAFTDEFFALFSRFDRSGVFFATLIAP